MPRFWPKRCAASATKALSALSSIEAGAIMGLPPASASRMPPPQGPELAAVPFWFLRHGETDWNTLNLAQGATDVKLNAAGLAQARLAAERLRGRGIRTLVSSPLSRARDTAELVSQHIGVPVQIDPKLRECAFGEREGQPMSEWFDAWVRGESTPPGAESFSDLKRRAAVAVGNALQLPGPVLIIAHGALFRAVRALMGMPPNVRTPNALPYLCRPPTGSDRPWTLTPAT
ncbi:Fructose-2,6-bisphosphatase [Granulibacter bethesdensis CGDNIH4]|nr:Fructose-2,6-bisphosphatase [Granulibacter bethesdensis CGDNIH4]